MSTLASVFGYGLLSARPAASVAGRFYYATDTSFMYRDNGSTWDTLAVGAGAMATDTLWDAAGDLAVGTGANTGAKLALTAPAANVLNVLGVANGETTPTWKGLFDATAPSTQAIGDAASAGTSLIAAHRDHKHAMPAATAIQGGELDYVEKTSATSVTATTEATANTVVTGNAVAYSGSQRIKIEFWCEYVIAPAAVSIFLALYDGASSIGIIGQVGNGSFVTPMYAVRFLTPSNASHTYSIRSYVGSGTGTVQGGAGGSGASMPAFIRITAA